MIGTKERIWRTALDLFAQKGFEATSVSDLAGRLGLSKGALYKHFADKRAILDEITRQMAEQDSLAAQKYAVPEETFRANPASYAHTELSQAIAFTKAQFGFWTKWEQSFAAYLLLSNMAAPNLPNCTKIIWGVGRYYICKIFSKP